MAEFRAKHFVCAGWLCSFSWCCAGRKWGIFAFVLTSLSDESDREILAGYNVWGIRCAKFRILALIDAEKVRWVISSFYCSTAWRSELADCRAQLVTALCCSSAQIKTDLSRYTLRCVPTSHQLWCPSIRFSLHYHDVLYTDSRKKDIFAVSSQSINDL